MKHTKLSLSSTRPATSPLVPRQRGLSAAAAAVLGKSLGSLALLAMAGSAVAQTYTYNPTSVTENWSVTTNWNLSTPPVSGTDTIIVFNPTGGTFPGAVTNLNTNNLGTMQLNQLLLQGVGPAADTSPVVITIAGDPLDFNISTAPVGPVIQLDATNGVGAGSTVTYNVTSAITLTADTTVQGNGNAGFNFSGVISGPSGLTKTGNSTLTLSGANTYSGLTTITGGTLAYGASNVISGDVYVNGATAVLALGANSDTIANVTLDGGSITGTGTLTATNPFEMRSGTASVVLGGTVGLTKNFVGTVVLSGINTYSGATTINDGVLSISGASGLGDGSLSNTITFNGGVLQATAGLDLGANRTVTVNGFGGALQSDAGTLTVSGTVTLNGGSTLTVQGASNTLVTSIIGDGGSGGGLTKGGAGTLTLNSANTYTGVTTVSAGTLAYGVNDAISSGNVTVSGGTLSLGTFSDTVGVVTLSGGNITGTGTLTSTADFDVRSGSASAVLGGAVGLTKSTGGIVTLSGANTYSGVTTVGGGTLKVSASGNIGNAAGTNTIVLSGAGVLNSTATLDLGATRSIALTGAGSLQSDTGTTLTVSGNVDLGANTLSIPGAGNTIITGNITGIALGSISKSAGGTLTLSGSNNYVGNTTISGGSLNINSATALGTGTLVLSGGSTINNTSATPALVLTNNNNINLSGGDLTYTGTSGNSLSFGTGVLTVSGGNRVVTVNGGTLTIGSIDADTTARTLQKAGGGGTLAITGAAGANFQGGFTLNGGTLLLGNKDALGTGTIIGQSGTLQASANLSGANKLPNALTLTALTVSGTNNIELGGKLSGLSGGDRTLTSSITGSAGLTLNAVDINTSTTAAQALIIAGTGLTTVNGVIANGGTQAHKLTITSTGTVTLNGANTFTGLLYVNGNNTTTVVNLNGNNIAATGGVMWEKGKLNINSPTALGTGTFSNLGGSTMGLDNTSGAPVVLTTNNLISLTEQFTFSTNTGTTNNNLTFGTGDVNFPNSRQYTMNGAGVLTFGGNLVNTGAGNRQLTVNNGATTTTFGSMNFGGLVITGTGAGPTARVFTISGSGKVGFNGAITDGIVAGGSLLYNGTGTLTLNAASTFTGGFTQNAATGGIVQIGSDTAVGTGTLTFNSGNGAMQAVGGTRTLANNISFSNTNVTFSGTNNFVFNGTAAWNGSNNLTVNNPMTTFNGTFTLRSDGSIAQRTVTFNGTGQTVMNGAILNGSTTNGIVQLSGTGVVSLNGNNNFTGDLTVNTGSTLKLGNTNGLGFGGLGTVNGRTDIKTGATVDLNGQTAVNEQFILNGTGVGGVGALINSSGTPAVIGSGVAVLQVGSGGGGYSTAPAVVASGGGGSGATAITTLGLSANSFTINLNGTTYTVAPTTVTISGGGGSGATATINTAGVVTITNPGVGYTSAPTIAISGGTFTGGSGMSGTGNATNFVVGAFQLTAAGSGYTSNPTFTVDPGTTGTATATVNRTSVALNASSTIGGVGDIIVNSAITGGGGNTLTKDGAGKLIFAGTNTYSGPTTITTGTIQVGNGGTTGTLGTGAITNNAALAFNRTDSITVSNVISGTGTLTQQGVGGTTILTGANTYAGITTISNGTLQIGNGSTAGALGTGNVTNNASLVFNRSNTYTVANAISGTGSVTKQGTGTTILTAANSYGTTTVSAGVLQIGDGGTTGSLGSGAVTDNASLVFNRSNTQTVTNAISGTGSVTNNGGAANVLNLNGAQSYATLNANSGTTNVNSSFTAPATVNANGGSLTFSSNQTLAALNIGAGATVTFQDLPSFADFGGPATAAVPEPGTMGLLLVGALGMLARRRRKD